MIDFKPSQVLSFSKSYAPFLNTFGKAETELAAAILVDICRWHGDRWQPISRGLMTDWAKQLSPHWKLLLANPFLTVRFPLLVDGGFVTINKRGRNLRTDVGRA